MVIFDCTKKSCQKKSNKNLGGNVLFLFLHSQNGNDSVAQLVEQYTFNVWALGSSPSGITGFTSKIMKAALVAAFSLGKRVAFVGLVGCKTPIFVTYTLP